MKHLLDVLTWLKDTVPLALIVAYLYLKRQNASADKLAAIDHAAALVETYVGTADAVARDLKNPGTEGKFTPEDGAALKHDVLTRAQSALGPDGVKRLQWAIGTVPVIEFLGDQIEAKVTALRSHKPAPIAATVQTKVEEGPGGTSTTVTSEVKAGETGAAPAEPVTLDPALRGSRLLVNTPEALLAAATPEEAAKPAVVVPEMEPAPTTGDQP